jgi:hypothetical protein
MAKVALLSKIEIDISEIDDINFAKYMSAQTLAHYGHVVGSVVKEFLDKVMPIITE